MAQPFRNAAIFAKPRTEGNRPALHHALLKLLGIVEKAGVNALLDAATRDAAGMTPMPGFSLAEIGARADVAIVLGGDGTMLGIAREMSAYQVPMIGINFGRLGFITDIAFDHMPEVLADLLAGRYETDHRPLLEAEVLHAGMVTTRAHALNDVVVSHGVAGG
ncbi:MAG TPA: NAD(+)/NADH kinase, partial [Burkholderiaceae bacterium]